MSWPVVKLGELVEITEGGGTPSKHVEGYHGGHLPWASVRDFNGRVIYDTRDYITQAGLESSATLMIPAGTIVITTRMALGKVALTGCNMAINQDIKALFIKNREQVCTEFLLRFLESKADYLEAQGQGATIKDIELTVLKELATPLPPLAEQQRITVLLEKAEQLRQKRQQTIVLADEFLRSLFLDMFGDPVTNPKGWKALSLDQVGTLDREIARPEPKDDPALLDGLPSRMPKEDAANGNENGNKNDKGCLHEYDARNSDDGLEQGRIGSDNLLSITISANIAKTCMPTSLSALPDSEVGFIPNEKVTVEYVQYGLRFLQKMLDANAAESAQKNIPNRFRELKLPVPDIAMQNDFSRIVARKAAIKEQVKCHSEKLHTLFNALRQKAFAGEL